jgi:TPR repeat protein
MADRKYTRVGSADAKYFLARALAMIFVEPSDNEKANGWYRAAADEGHIAAHNALWGSLAGGNFERELDSLRRAA